MKKRQPPPSVFAIGRMSSLKEYIRFKPECIESVSCPPAMISTIGLALREAGRDDLIPAEGREGQRDDDGVSFRVRLRTHGEETLLADLPPESDVLLALDQVTDPRNLGAIIRTAAWFGVRNVIAGARRQVLLTPASVATSQGGFSLVRLIEVVNTGRILARLKEHGYWILGADAGGEDISQVRGRYEKVCLVLGSEEKGLSKGIRQKCDLLVAAGANPGPIDSLNVAVAAGICLHELCK